MTNRANACVGHCEIARSLAKQLGASQQVQLGLGQVFERWDGKGLPARLKQEQLLLPVRVAHLAQQAVLSDQLIEDGTRAIADFVDLKSPYLAGHSSGVAALAAAAAQSNTASNGLAISSDKSGLCDWPLGSWQLDNVSIEALAIEIAEAAGQPPRRVGARCGGGIFIWCVFCFGAWIN